MWEEAKGLGSAGPFAYARSFGMLVSIFRMLSSLAKASFVVACCLLGAMAVGCGGSDGTAATSVSKPQFIEAADAICKKADQAQNAELEAYLKASPKAESSEAEQIKMISAAGLPAIKAEIGELAELEAPQGDGDEVSAIVGEMESALEESEADPSKVLDLSKSPFKEAEARAGKYGFKECNKPL